MIAMTDIMKTHFREQISLTLSDLLKPKWRIIDPKAFVVVLCLSERVLLRAQKEDHP
jgi:hypothetical protein